MKSVRELNNVAGKVVLVRADFNVESAQDAFKLERSLPTIQYLKQQQAIVLLMSHRGRPEGKTVPELSLDFVLPFLRQYVSQHVDLIPHGDMGAIKQRLAAAQPGSVFVLENIRFLPGEEKNDAQLATELASLGQYYVNDAFAVDHHGAVSVSELPKLLPAYAGLLVEEEVTHLSRVMKTSEQPLVVIIGGGGKAGEKFAVIENLYARTTTFLIGGVMANTFLKARGIAIGASQTDETIAASVQKYLHDPKILLPTDWVSNEQGMIMDVGTRTATAFASAVSGAKTVIWNGPLGKFEDPQYRAGSRVLAQAIAQSGAFSVVGGGETTQFLLEEKLEKQFGFLSTGGGAMLAYLAGKPMPGLDALE